MTQVIEAAQTEEKKPAAEDLATHDFMTALPIFKKKAPNLSRRQLARVIEALIEYPLNDQPFRFSYPEEVELFKLGMVLLDSKFVLIKAGLELSKEEQEKLAKEGTKNEEL